MHDVSLGNIHQRWGRDNLDRFLRNLSTVRGRGFALAGLQRQQRQTPAEGGVEMERGTQPFMGAFGECRNGPK